MESLRSVYGPSLVAGNMRGARYNGMSGSVITSWLQKAIRRGKYDEARFAAALKIGFCSEGDSSHFTNLCNRLEIIAAEDVGLGAPYLFDLVVYKVSELTSQIHARRKSTSTFTLTASDIHMVLSIVGALCRAGKNRNMSHLRAVCSGSEGRHWDAASFPSIPASYTDVLRLHKSEVLTSHVKGVSPKLLAWLRRGDRQAKAEWELAALLVTIRRAVFTADEREHHKRAAMQLFNEESALPMRVPAVCTLSGEMRDVVLDVHTGAKRKTASALADFAARGAFVDNEVVVLPHHDELKSTYYQSKLAKDVPRKKPRTISVDATPFADTLPAIPANTFVLNFKKPIYAIDDYVYKFDHVGRFDYTIRCEGVRRALGMETIDCQLHPCVTFESSDLSPLCYPSEGWRFACQRHLNTLKGKAAVLVGRKFDGGRLSHASLTQIDWWSLAEVMIFRRALGCTDTNGCNILISNVNGRALSIDENFSKGHTVNHVFTAQKMHKTVVSSLSRLAAGRAHDVAQFAQRVREAAEHMPELDRAWVEYCIHNPATVFLM